MDLILEYFQPDRDWERKKYAHQGKMKIPKFKPPKKVPSMYLEPTSQGFSGIGHAGMSFMRG